MKRKMTAFYWPAIMIGPCDGVFIDTSLFFQFFDILEMMTIHKKI
jgi:hypothetical protein